MAYIDRRQRNIEIFEDTRDWYTRDAKLKQAVQHYLQHRLLRFMNLRQKFRMFR